ncbi:MAG TPA: ATP-binding protein, partial [Anaerolineales bacterium]|nr:ATP-binding protein [Anaerolineales bacterium]
QTINFPYFVDRFDQPENEVPYDDKTITAYVLRTGRSLLCTKEVSLELERQGEVDMAGTEPEIWLGAPLILDNETIGVIAMQHYDDPAAYTTQDQRILEFVSTEVAKAIHSKRTEKALLESERRFRSVVEASPFGLHLYRLMPDGRLILIATNQSADEILGINHSELIGKTIEEAFPGLADSNIPEEYRKAAAEGIFWKSRQYNYEDDMIQGVFEIFAFQISPNEMAALFQDITDRIKTESALVESEKRFRSVVESSPLAIFIYHLAENEDLILLDSNPAADEVFGLDCKQYIGKKIEDAFPALAGVEAMDIYRRIARSGGVWQSDDVHYQGDKTASAFELFAFQISPQRVAVMYQDVTNRLKNEEEIRRLNEELEERVATRTVELQAANREMEAFAYSVSHDLRAPVRSIKGFSELLIAEKDDLSGQEFEDLLRRIYNSSIKMDELIDDLLSLSYLEKQKLKIRSINLSEIVEKICEQVGEEFPDAQFRTVINKTPDIRADKSMVTIMLTNLLTNAFKFTADQPKPTITFGSKHHGNEATFYLHDNGIGFEMEYAEKIFAPFERLHPSEYDGTGIGLAIARRVIQRHNGRIWAVSKLGEGTTFYFSLGTQEMIG